MNLVESYCPEIFSEIDYESNLTLKWSSRRELHVYKCANFQHSLPTWYIRVIGLGTLYTRDFVNYERAEKIHGFRILDTELYFYEVDDKVIKELILQNSDQLFLIV